MEKKKIIKEEAFKFWFVIPLYSILWKIFEKLGENIAMALMYYLMFCLLTAFCIIIFHLTKSKIKEFKDNIKELKKTHQNLKDKFKGDKNES